MSVALFDLKGRNALVTDLQGHRIVPGGGLATL
jgi:hypothetical protein